ncbi:hypothetical protein [Streptomyces pini]|uniref:Holliday junction resolvasome RuvABC endonuclease subunit n=1 Tax=Streptomyces pini TaxID=1520580 RepID=A0A1I4C390_9ACTN|nr:hypothetical protein [Streptomyces pini]SFK74877.1 Holliday junction resolvasome RuvABC endonuclease subunit [Streptomyces pini]
MTATIPGLLPAGVPLDDAPAVPVGLRVLGLDLSLTSTGVCLPDGSTFRIRTRQKDGDARLCVIRDRIAYELGQERPDVAVIEDLPKHAMGAGITAMVHGVVRAALADDRIPYALVVPATLKSYACDNGRADKREMADAAYLAAGVKFPGDLNARGEGGDMCDAWWLRVAGLDHYGHPLFDLPAGQRERLRKVDWPTLAEVA